VQEFNDSLRKKYDSMKDSAEELALMVKTMLDVEGFWLEHPEAAKLLFKYLDNLNKKINIINREAAINENL
jgi:hypothetical protein